MPHPDAAAVLVPGSGAAVAISANTNLTAAAHQNGILRCSGAITLALNASTSFGASAYAIIIAGSDPVTVSADGVTLLGAGITGTSVEVAANGQATLLSDGAGTYHIGGAISDATFTIAQLFANGEKGFIADFSDLTTLSQAHDAATPLVTADGQPIGRVGGVQNLAGDSFLAAPGAANELEYDLTGNVHGALTTGGDFVQKVVNAELQPPLTFGFAVRTPASGNVVPIWLGDPATSDNMFYILMTVGGQIRAYNRAGTGLLAGNGVISTITAAASTSYIGIVTVAANGDMSIQINNEAEQTAVLTEAAYTPASGAVLALLSARDFDPTTSANNSKLSYGVGVDRLLTSSELLGLRQLLAARAEVTL